MLYKASKAVRRLPADERARRIATMQRELQAGFVARNRGRRCDVRAGRVNAATGECTLLEDVVLGDVRLVERGAHRVQLMFEIVTHDGRGAEWVSHTDDIADVMFRT